MGDQFPTLAEAQAMNYIADSLILQHCITFYYNRISFEVRPDHIDIRLNREEIKLTEYEPSDELIAKLREPLKHARPVGYQFYPAPRSLQGRCRLSSIDKGQITIDVQLIANSGYTSMDVSVDVLRDIRNQLLDIACPREWIEIEAGKFCTFITAPKYHMTIFKPMERSLLELCNTVLGPLGTYNLTTYMCVVGAKTVAELIEPILPYYGGKYLHTHGHHHHYVFPSEQMAEEAYQKIHRLDGVDLALSAYMLGDCDANEI